MADFLIAVIGNPTAPEAHGGISDDALADCIVLLIGNSLSTTGVGRIASYLAAAICNLATANESIDAARPCSIHRAQTLAR